MTILNVEKPFLTFMSEYIYVFFTMMVPGNWDAVSWKTEIKTLVKDKTSKVPALQT